MRVEHTPHVVLKGLSSIFGQFQSFKFSRDNLSVTIYLNYLMERDRLFWISAALFWVGVCQCGLV